MAVPDFSDRIVADQGFAIIRALEADADVAAYFSEGILDAEETDGYIGTAAPPCLLVALDGMELKPEVGGVGTLTTIWKLTAVTPKRNAITTSGFLRARTFTRMARLAWGEESGVLRDEAGAMLTEAVLTFQRFGVPRFGPDETVRADMFLLFDATVEMESLQFVT